VWSLLLNLRVVGIRLGFGILCVATNIIFVLFVSESANEGKQAQFAKVKNALRQETGKDYL
jgi:hypothetical protein